MPQQQREQQLLSNMLKKHPHLACCRDDMAEAYELMKTSFKNTGKLLAAGNGGSAADCEHIIGELMKGFMSRRALSGREQRQFGFSPKGREIAAHLQGALPAVSLVSQSALISAFSNDVKPELVYAQQVLGLGRPEDVYLGLSTSGNSENVVCGALTARAKGLKTIAITGQDGGKLAGICDVTIRIPSSCTPEVQEGTLPVYHTLCMMLEEHFFGTDTRED